MKTGEGRSRIEMDDEMRQTKRARVEASVNDEPMSVERGEGHGNQSVSSSSKRRDDRAAQGQVGANSEVQAAVLQFRKGQTAKRQRQWKRARSGSRQVEQPELAELPEETQRNFQRISSTRTR